MVRRVAAAQRGGEIVREHPARHVLGHRAPRVEDLRVAEAVGGAQEARQQLAQLGAEEAGGAEAMRLEHRDDAGGARLGGRQRGADLLAVVRVVVHHADAARGDADQLEAARHPGEAAQRVLHRARPDAELERDQRGGGGVLEVVGAGLGDVEGQRAAGRV